MEEVQKSTGRYWGIGIVVGILAVIAIVYIRILGMNAEEQEELLYLVQDFLPIIMFGTLACLLFSGFPVAFILGGIALSIWHDRLLDRHVRSDRVF